jgi:hypothetical protein
MSITAPDCADRSEPVGAHTESAGDWVPASPFCRLFRSLVDGSGLPARVVALAIGIPQRLAMHLVSGHGQAPLRRIPRTFAERIADASLHSLRSLADRPVAVTGTDHAYRSLGALGLSPVEIARRSGCTVDDVLPVLAGTATHTTRKMELLAIAAACAAGCATEEMETEGFA